MFAGAVLLFFGASSTVAAAQGTSDRKDTIFIQNSIKVVVFGSANANGGDGQSATGAGAGAKALDNKEEYDYKPVLALRTNLLLPLMNVGVQIPLGNRFSIGADWYYPFLRREWSEHLNQTNCFQALGPGADLRIYFGKQHAKGRENWQYRFSGHSLGLYGMYGRYDVEWQFDGEQARFYTAGIDYMYSARIGKRKRMRLDMSLGVGYYHSRAVEYHVFRPGGDAYKTGRIYETTFIGPTKATVSLVIPLHRKVERRDSNE